MNKIILTPFTEFLILSLILNSIIFIAISFICLDIRWLFEIASWSGFTRLCILGVFCFIEVMAFAAIYDESENKQENK